MKSGLCSLERTFYRFLRRPGAPYHREIWRTSCEMWKLELTFEHNDRAKVPWSTGEKSSPVNVSGKGRLPDGHVQISQGLPDILPFLEIPN